MKSWQFAASLVLTGILVACGGTAGEAGPKAPKQSSRTSLTQCQALYASAPSGAQVSSNLRYGSVGTLILGFLEDASKARAIDWIDANLGLTAGNGLGVFENLPVVAVKTLITQELVQRIKAALEPAGLVSIEQDEPLKFFLNTSVGFIGADRARAAFGLSGKGVGVAVIDSGIDATHPDLVLGKNVGRNVKIVGPITDTPVGGYLYADLDNTDLTSGHGTHVAGTIAGLGTASQGKYTGVAPGATLLGIGTGDGISILYALQGFDFALKPEIREKYNVRVISNSWGTSGRRFDPYNAIALASKRAYDLGVLVVFAAGNDGPDPDTLNPYSASPCVISVAAGDKRGFLADFSSRGVPGDALHHPDITAPGVSIIAARAKTGAVTPPYTGDPLYGAFYSSISGTSMATPHVSGTLALMLEANPKLRLEGALEMMSKTARPMYYQADGFTVKRRELWEVGAGYLDAYEAVRLAVKSNPNRYTLTTDTLSAWSGTVGAAACAPLVGCATKSQHEYTVSVPAGYTALHVRTDWGNPALDLDLYVYAPDGRLMGSSAQGASSGEAVSIPNPQAGSWKVVLEGYLNTPTTYEGVAEGDKLVRQ
ncbi:Serine protease AprX [Calidithermus terrae]|uniref:Serine protease AprX n=1 Tax=Calidithermus terrae TaxID=1408545 RepID=A0A399EHA3_9DEIN|nr:S8 family serine peptidase [Calidithermus terrae]RIH81662.1 Serine protease AprX [Calidithermus terrae]